MSKSHDEHWQKFEVLSENYRQQIKKIIGGAKNGKER